MILALAAVALAAGVVSLLLPRDNLLEQAATLRLPLHGRTFVTWVSDTEVILLKSGGFDGTVGLAGQHPVAVDVRSGRETPLPDLEGSRDQEPIGAAKLAFASGSLSPEGHALFVRSGFFLPASPSAPSTITSKPARMYVLNTVDHTVRRLPADPGLAWCGWQPDSKAIVGIKRTRPPDDTPGESNEKVEFQIIPVGRTRAPSTSRWFDRWQKREAPLGYTVAGRFVSAQDLGPIESAINTGDDVPFRRAVRIITRAGTSPPARVNCVEIPYPPGAEIVYCKASAVVDRLLWQTISVRQDHSPYWFQQVKQRLGVPEPTPCVSLWTSSQDGRAMHRLGSSYLAGRDAYAYGTWTPDGRHVSCVLRDTLYVINAP